MKKITHETDLQFVTDLDYKVYRVVILIWFLSTVLKLSSFLLVLRTSSLSFLFPAL